MTKCSYPPRRAKRTKSKNSIEGASMIRNAALVGFVCSLFVMTSWAQVITGTVSGTVKDASGALLPGVTIEVQNTDTGVNRMLTTDERGYYVVPNLSPSN